MIEKDIYTEGGPVVRPTHYNTGKIEVIDFINDQKLNFNTGNAIKYVCRAGKKDPARHIEDLEKAIYYLRKEVDYLKRDAAEKAQSDPLSSPHNPRPERPAMGVHLPAEIKK